MRRFSTPANAVLLAGILVFALNLRAPIAALSPVVSDVTTDLHLTPASVGLLTGVPVLCFAALTPAASALLARLGIGAAVTVSLATILAGTILRSVGGFPTALAGTTLIGAAIAIGNVAVPVIVSRDFPTTAGTVTGLYTAALNTGTVATTVGTAPLADAVGWRWALASWGLLAVAGLITWRYAAPHLRRPPTSTIAPAPPGTRTNEPGPDEGSATGVLRTPLTWLLAVAFGGQAFGYYAVTAWLPTILADSIGLAVTSAGGGASLFQLLAIVGGIGIPVALARGVPIRAVTAIVALFWCCLPLGLLAAPELWPLWCALAGVAQGGNFTVIFTMVATRAGPVAAARRMSATVQTFGYACAATGPSVLGAVHSATGTWSAPLGVVFVLLGLMTAAMLIATSLRPPAPDVHRS